jgi:hypothetical protein
MRDGSGTPSANEKDEVRNISQHSRRWRKVTNIRSRGVIVGNEDKDVVEERAEEGIALVHRLLQKILPPRKSQLPVVRSALARSRLHRLLLRSPAINGRNSILLK